MFVTLTIVTVDAPAQNVLYGKIGNAGLYNTMDFAQFPVTTVISLQLLDMLPTRKLVKDIFAI